MEEFLLAIKVLQEKRIKQGTGVFSHDRVLTRCNPWNPLSYVTIAVMFAGCLIAYGVVGVIKEINKNPFKYT